MTMTPLIKQAFKINNKPASKRRAINAAICAAVPIIMGLLLGNLQLGMVSSLGGFVYLYISDEPYLHRVKKIFFVSLGISLTAFVATLLAGNLILVAIGIAFVGAVSTFVFGVINTPGPSGIFFVLTFSMISGMQVDPSQAFNRAFIIFLSGMFSLAISLIVYVGKKHRLEVKLVKMTYLFLAKFSNYIMYEDIDNMKESTMNALNTARDTLYLGLNTWKVPPVFNKLFFLVEYGNKLFIEMLEFHYIKKTRLPDEFKNIIREISNHISEKDTEKVKLNIDILPNTKEYEKIRKIVLDIENLINTNIKDVEKFNFSKPSFIKKLIKECTKESIIFIGAIRYGIIMLITALVSLAIPFSKPHWITLSCAAVMTGGTVVSTLHRSIQRSIGTIIGLLVAMIILKFNPNGYIIIILNVVLTAVTEIYVVKNYALAALFFTPNAMILSAFTSIDFNFKLIATARLTDVIVGSVIGLIGVYMLGRKSATKRLHTLMAALIRSQGSVLVSLASKETHNDLDFVKQKMEINLMNLKITYNVALGEISNDKKMLKVIGNAVSSLDHMSYLIDSVFYSMGRLTLSDEEVSKVLFVLEKLALSIEQHHSITDIQELNIRKEIPKLCKEINTLQAVLSIKNS